MCRPILALVLLALVAPGCRGPKKLPPMPSRVDHLIFVAPDLESGMDEIERLLGVRPVRGGRHPGFGTHNALLSLGPTTYLEVIAPDPKLPRPERGLIFGLDEVEDAHLASWVLSTDDIHALHARAERAGVGLGQVESGSREKPDGSVLRWRMTDPYAWPLDGAVPFVISWGESSHPAGAAPSGGTLLALRIEHPDVKTLRRSLSALGAKADAHAGERVRLVATLRTPAGKVVSLE